MRRSTAISQLLLLLALVVAPLVASSSSAIPACCRRDGAHHCEMQEQATKDQTTSSRAAFRSSVHCPYRIPAILLTHTTQLFLNHASVTAFLSGSSEIAVHNNDGAAPTLFAVALENRGPPALTL